ncbi:3-oxo-tetronate kinase [Fluviibacterium sp. DFM31]|uniref:3-oxo-tetronate kinase n=1 Tax=Meridianimarinicoccus marinus TaxID=3231483 RepID=A0ABV3L8A7_9RHOB
MTVVLGAIADDFTGATDLANTLVKEGMRVVQVIGVPDADTDVGDAQAVVVALKSRTAPVDQAVSQSLQALDWLRGQGAEQILFKYCSTFDSTEHGNIGPVTDALRAALDTDFALVCPAFPANGRTIYQGHLFVGDQLLSDSPMKNHPLTPMRDANLLRLMDAQSTGRAGLIGLGDVMAGPEAILARIEALRQAGIHHGVADAVRDEDLRAIGRAAARHVLVTGGSGIAMGLPDNLRAQGRLDPAAPTVTPGVAGRAVVLAGSCSEATRGQIAAVRDLWPVRKLDVDRIAAGQDVVGEMLDWACAQPDGAPILIYGSADPEEVRRTQAKYGVTRAGEMVEDALGRIATGLHAAGFARMVVAGGETSGAVVSALGVTALRIGPEIATGVPWTEAVGGTPLALALKSGNFGGPAFFDDAFAVLDQV